MEDNYIRFDWAIKRLLRQKANFGVLEGLLTVLLDEKVEIIELLESESNQQTFDDKFNRVDIKAKNSKVISSLWKYRIHVNSIILNASFMVWLRRLQNISLWENVIAK